jgi:hypothetical protein
MASSCANGHPRRGSFADCEIAGRSCAGGHRLSLGWLGCTMAGSCANGHPGTARSLDFIANGAGPY